MDARSPVRRHGLSRRLWACLACAAATVVLGAGPGTRRSAWSAPPDARSNPYGVCAHLHRDEAANPGSARRQLAAMRQAGVGWARADFSWRRVAPRDGQWDFSTTDRTVARAEQAGVKILPILDYDVPWAAPAWRHLDKWTGYVRRVVTRYKDRLRCWEVWNEEDSELYWKDKPDPAHYAALLRATHAAIKGIDPGLTVLFGGTSRIPWRFIEGVHQAGASESFDVMNIHPYRTTQSPESLHADLVKLRALMTRCGDGTKPIWITEICWPTYTQATVAGKLLHDLFAAGVNAIRGEPAVAGAAILVDRRHREIQAQVLEYARVMAGTAHLTEIDADKVAAMDPARVQVLIMPPREGFPAEGFDAIESYVRRGGIVVFWSGVPLYYAERPGPDGACVRKQASEAFRRRLHIGWEASWTRRGVPRSVQKLEAPPPLRKLISLPRTPMTATRFLTDAALRPGDRMVPLLLASKGDYRGVPAAAYALDSDLKGGAIVIAARRSGGISPTTVSPERQAVLLPRAYLTAFGAGVERVFWYVFRDSGRAIDSPFSARTHGSNYGVLHPDLTPKPAYDALRALTRARPPGSTPVPQAWPEDGVHCMHWRRPDGRPAWALWSATGKQARQLRIRGAVQEAFDHLGRPVTPPGVGAARPVTLRESTLYLIGPESVTVAR